MKRQMPTKPAQYRLPQWAHEFVAEEAERYGVTKTEVVVRALSRLRQDEAESLMAEGYRELASTDLRMAEENVVAATEVLPEW